MLSKCVHMEGVGLVNRPWAKVSAASSELKSFGENGKGMGQRGRMAMRKRSAENPTTATARLLRRANLPSARSIRAKKDEPRRGHARTTATAIPVRPASIKTSEGPGCKGVDWSITVLYSDCVKSAEKTLQ